MELAIRPDDRQNQCQASNNDQESTSRIACINHGAQSSRDKNHQVSDRERLNVRRDAQGSEAVGGQGSAGGKPEEIRFRALLLQDATDELGIEGKAGQLIDDADGDQARDGDPDMSPGQPAPGHWGLRLSAPLEKEKARPRIAAALSERGSGRDRARLRPLSL